MARKRRAFTLIELIVTMVIIVIIALIGIYALTATADSWSLVSLQDEAVSSAVVAMNRISREIRSVKDNASITTAADHQFVFTDTNDAAIDYNLLSGTTMLRNADGLIDNVSALTFTYYDGTDTVMTTPVAPADRWKIRRIVVDMSVTAGSAVLPFQFQVRLQNMPKLNEKFK